MLQKACRVPQLGGRNLSASPKAGALERLDKASGQEPKSIDSVWNLVAAGCAAIALAVAFNFVDTTSDVAVAIRESICYLVEVHLPPWAIAFHRFSNV